MSPVAELRNKLLCAGYSPIPVIGKRPASIGWQEKLVTNADEIKLWDRVFPQASNTGILTKVTPTIDIDILNPEAAVAIEELARERFEERGFFLVRIGKAPKRAVPLRTDVPFKKIAQSFVSPCSSESDPEKIELLGDGQQVVVFGTHKDTGKPYSWHGGEPGKIKRADLPYVSAEEAQKFIEDAERLLVSEFGYKAIAARKKKPNGQGEGGGSDDWAHLARAILEGAELHDSICAVAAKLVASGMAEGAAVNQSAGGWNAPGYHETSAGASGLTTCLGPLGRRVKSSSGKQEGPDNPKRPSGS
jgi:Bifunctional DNA primase/polymerase, N-terminal